MYFGFKVEVTTQSMMMMMMTTESNTMFSAIHKMGRTIHLASSPGLSRLLRCSLGHKKWVDSGTCYLSF